MEPDWVPMKPNTALAFAFAGVALGLIKSNAKTGLHRLALACSGIVAMVGLLTSHRVWNGLEPASRSPALRRSRYGWRRDPRPDDHCECAWSSADRLGALTCRQPKTLHANAKRCAVDGNRSVAETVGISLWSEQFLGSSSVRGDGLSHGHFVSFDERRNPVLLPGPRLMEALCSAATGGVMARRSTARGAARPSLSAGFDCGDS